VEPLKPDTKRQQNRPQVSQADIDEYERLLAERFTVDPDLPQTHTLKAAATQRETRLQQLYMKLFGP
jgi:hypothetical protein